jgi:hypothetical protein
MGFSRTNGGTQGRHPSDGVLCNHTVSYVPATNRCNCNLSNTCNRGWQQSTINAAALGWACEFKFDVDYCPPGEVNRHRSKLLFGLINAAPPLVGSLVYVSSAIDWTED